MGNVGIALVVAAWLFFSVGLIVALSQKEGAAKESFEEAGYGSNGVFVR